jgi:hypothetical protein
MRASVEQIEGQIREYVEHFLKTEYGEQAVKKLAEYTIEAVYAYDNSLSEVTGNIIKIAAKRDMDIGKLTDSTKLTIRHELGHILDENLPDFPDFDAVIEHERIAWVNAKLKTPLENWCKNLAMRTHLDPLKMQAIGFPCPEIKVSPDQLQRGISMEIERMSKDSPFVDEHLAERYAMVNLIENPNYYDSKRNPA